jgi:hypothetical protein
MGGACSTHGETRIACKISLGKRKEKNHSEDLNIDARIILKWVLG